ncbi:MAG TPA: HAD family phosphatase [Anaerolineales bacterium]|nr:HAD family phosphatase [Anaerolineales bacterium]
MTIKAVLFDLGGVIVRTDYQAPRERLAERLNMTYEDLDQLVFNSDSAQKASVGAMTAKEHWASVTRKLGRPVSEAQAIREEFFAGDVVDRTLLDFIRSLRPRYKTGLISNAWPDLRQYIVEMKFEDAFDAQIISAEVGVTKPEAKIFQIALEQLQIKANEAAFIDDVPANVEAARGLGLHGIVFENPTQTLEELREILR